MRYTALPLDVWQRPAAPLAKAPQRGHRAVRAPVPIALTIACAFGWQAACQREDPAPKLPTQRDYVGRVRRCGKQVAAEYARSIRAHLRRQTASVPGQPATPTADPDDPAIQRGTQKLARWMHVQLVRRLQRVATERHFRLLLTRGALRPLVGCYRKKSCRAFASCTVRVLPDRDLRRLTVADVLAAGGAPARPRPPATSTPPAAAGGQPRGQPTTHQPLPRAPLPADRPDLSRPEARWSVGPLGPLPAAGVPPVWVIARNQLLLVFPQTAAPGRRASARRGGGPGAPPGAASGVRVDLSDFLSRVQRHAPQVLTTPHGHVLIKTDTALLAVDRQRTPHVIWRPRPGRHIGAATWYAGHLLVAAEGSFIVLGPRWRERGRANLGLRRPDKEAHDILVHRDAVGLQALLLDNVVWPIYLFRVDLTDLARPRILARVQEHGRNPHLLHQWVDPKARRWGVLVHTGGRGGSEQTAVVLRLRPPKRPPLPPRAPRHPRHRIGPRILPNLNSPAAVGATVLYRHTYGRCPPASKRGRGQGRRRVHAGRGVGGWLDRHTPRSATQRFCRRTVGSRLLGAMQAPPHYAVTVQGRPPTLTLARLTIHADRVSVRRLMPLWQPLCGNRTASRSVRRVRPEWCRDPAEAEHALFATRGRWAALAVGDRVLWLRLPASGRGRPRLAGSATVPGTVTALAL